MWNVCVCVCDQGESSLVKVPAGGIDRGVVKRGDRGSSGENFEAPDRELCKQTA